MGWKSDGGWVFYIPKLLTYGLVDHFLGMAPEKQSALLESNISCSTVGDTHCLTFQYAVEGSGRTPLSVYVADVKSGARQKMWSTSSLADWIAASVPISTNFDFIVRFEAVRPANSPDNVYIDRIRYVPSACSLEPPNAAVLTTSTTTSSTATTTSIATITRSTKSDPMISTQDNSVMTNNQAESIAVIVGPVIAVLVIIVIIVVFIILYRRNKQRTTSCFKSAKGRESHRLRAVDNSAYNPHALGLEESAMTGVSGARGQAAMTGVSGARGQAAMTGVSGARGQAVHPSQSPHDDYNVGQAQDSTNTPADRDEYAVVNKGNKPQKAQKPSNPPPTQYEFAKSNKPQSVGPNTKSGYEVDSPSHSVYHVLERTPSQDVYQTPDADTELYGLQGACGPNTTEYNSLHHDGKGKNVQGYTGGDAVYSHLQAGEEGDYHSLHHDGKGQNVEGDDAVYSHLQAGEEGDYHQLDRHNKVKVVDDEYSHASQI